MYGVLSPVMGELAGVRERISRFYQLRAANIRDYAHLEEHPESFLNAALVFFSAGIQGKINDNVRNFADLFQMVHIASTIHQGINEDAAQNQSRPADPRDGCQYPVLVGDYLYSKAFSILVETGNIDHMLRLSEIVYQVNEGGIIRNKHNSSGGIRLEVWREIIRLEKAELMAGCCQMGALSSGADKECQSVLFDFGHALGMALGMAEIGRADQAEIYYNKALLRLDLLAPGKNRDNLENMLLDFMGKNIDREKMVC